MNAKRALKSLTALRAAGPYLLIELLMPGGTLVAFLLWVSQRIKRDGLDGVRESLSGWWRSKTTDTSSVAGDGAALESAACRCSPT